MWDVPYDDSYDDSCDDFGNNDKKVLLATKKCPSIKSPAAIVMTAS